MDNVTHTGAAVKNQRNFIIGMAVLGVVLAFFPRDKSKSVTTNFTASTETTAKARLEFQRERALVSQQKHGGRSTTSRNPARLRIEPKIALPNEENTDVTGSPLFPVYGYHWGREAIPELRDFSKWADEYANSSGRSKEPVAEGVERAKARREMMRTLIQMDPEAALASAIPRAVRVQLPAAVLDHSERHVSGNGNLVVQFLLLRLEQ